MDQIHCQCVSQAEKHCTQYNATQPTIYSNTTEVTANNKSLLLFAYGSVNTVALPLPSPVSPLPSLLLSPPSLFLPVYSYCSGLALPADWAKQTLTFTAGEKAEMRAEKVQEETITQSYRDNRNLS